MSADQNIYEFNAIIVVVAGEFHNWKSCTAKEVTVMIQHVTVTVVRVV